MTNRYLIIADDFTGATDTGVQLTKRHLRTTVHFTATGTPFQSTLVLDTESRILPPAAAYQQVKELTQVLLANQRFNLVYKKVDSTLRGNIAIEIKALCETYQPERIIFAPALPKNKRITYQGVQHLNGLPLMQTALAHDPLNPLWTDDLPTLLASVFSEKISHIVKDTLATITQRVMTEATLAGLLLSGGDTAMAVIQALAGTGCVIAEELSPGIVKSHLVGGPHASLPLVTKAGAFGNHRSLYHSLQHLKE